MSSFCLLKSSSVGFLNGVRVRLYLPCAASAVISAGRAMAPWSPVRARDATTHLPAVTVWNSIPSRFRRS